MGEGIGGGYFMFIIQVYFQLMGEKKEKKEK
jgi:hypothetical protein